MILDVTFNYAVTFRPRRKRNDDVKKYRGTIPIEVPELASEEAPIAFWFNHQGVTTQKDQACVRSIDGHLYMPVAMTSDTGIVPQIGSAIRQTSKQANFVMGAQFLNRVAQYPGYGHFEAKSISLAVDPEVPGLLEDDPLVAEVRSTTWDSSAKDIREWYDRLRIVDGVVYRRIGCPVFKVETRWNPRIVLTDGDRRYGAASDLSRTFRIDRFEDARKLFMDAAKKQGIGRSNDFDHLRPEIVDASLLNWDETRWLIEGAGEALLKPFQERHYSGSRSHVQLASANRDTLRAFVLLRDALHDGADLEVMTTHIDSMIAAMQAEYHSHRFNDVVAEVTAVRERLEREGYHWGPAPSAVGMVA